MILLGDRYETFAFAIAANFFKLPIAHIHGGELTYGLIDDSLRHAITKMSKFHFVSNIIVHGALLGKKRRTHMESEL